MPVDYKEFERMHAEVSERIKRTRAERKRKYERWADEWERKNFPPHWFNEDGSLKPHDEIEEIIKEDIKEGRLKAGTGYK